MRNRNENVTQLGYRKIQWAKGGTSEKERNEDKKIKMKNSIMNLTTNST